MNKLLIKRLALSVLLLGAAQAQKPELVGEPALELSEQVQYELRWQTLLPSLGRVEYGPDTAYSQTTAEAPALDGEHVHLLTNLTPGETYHYRLVTRDWAGNETVSENGTFVAAAVTPVAQPGTAAPAVSAPLVDDSFENGLDESVWSVYNNTESGELAVEDGQLVMRNVGDGTNYGQVGLVLQEPLDLTAAPTTITVNYTEAGNAEQNPGFWNAADLSGEDTWNHPGFRATVSGEGVSPTSTPPAEGVWTPPEGFEATPPYTLTWTITPPEGEGEFSSTMLLDGEEVYAGTFTPGSFNPEEAYFYLYVSSPTEEGTTAIDAVTVEQEGPGGTLAAAPEPTFEPGTTYPVTQGSLEVNGDLAELDGTTGVNLEEHATVQMEPYGGPEDLSGNMWLRWDDDNLYLAARVQDDVHAQEFAEGDMWQGDSLQLALAAGAPGEAEGWYEYGFALTGDGPQVWRWLAHEGVETGLVEGAALSVARDDEAGTTLYEVALPWAELAPLSAETAQTYAFSFIANDNDGDGRKGWVEVGSGVGGDKDPSLFLPFELAAASAGQAAAQGPTLPEGAVAAWLFDEGEGESVADAVGDNDGTFTNPQWAEGRFGSAAQIQPGQNYVSVPGSEALSPADALTVTAWVYLNAYGEGEFPNRRVLQLGTYDPESQYGIEDNSYRLLFEFGEFIFDAGPAAEPEQISVPQDEHITLETWHHVAGVYSGDAITLYIDGEQVAQQEANGAALSAPDGGRLFIGTKSDLAPEGDWWDGRIDEVAVFNRALSQDEIQGVMTGLAAAPQAAVPAAPQAGTEDPAIFRADGAITVDGDLSDWSQRGPITVDSSLVADAPDVEGDSDLSLVAHLAYDDDWVYVGADVTDDVLVFERTGDAIWQTDSLEFWLGPQQLGATISDAAPYLHSFGGGVDIEEAEVALTPYDGGYTLEVALPRGVVEETLEITFEEGTTVPVAVGANDSDEEGTERQGQVYFPEGWTWGEVDTFAPLSVAP